MRYTILLSFLLVGCLEIRDDSDIKQIDLDVDCEKQTGKVRIILDESGQATKVKPTK